MEKNHWHEAKYYLQQAMDLTNGQNHEVMRCYGLCEYWYGNREKGLRLVKDAFVLNMKDAEVIYNLIELYILEQKYKQAKDMIRYFYKHHDELQTIDKPLSFYDKKIALFERFITTERLFHH